MRSRLAGLRVAGMARVLRCDSGVSALEFSLLAPVLVFSLIAMTDVGFGVFENMTIRHALRAGAQIALDDPGAAVVLARLRTTAAQNFTVAPTKAPVSGMLAVSAVRICACATALDTELVCSATCSGQKPTQLYYRLTGDKTYKGMILPQVRLNPSLLVQIR